MRKSIFVLTAILVIIATGTAFAADQAPANPAQTVPAPATQTTPPPPTPAQPPQPATPPSGPQSPAIMSQLMAQPINNSSHSQGSAINSIALSPDTFVTVKDNGDSQTIQVFKVDDQGNLRRVTSKKFSY